MGLKIANMKDRFYQWDTGQHLIVEKKCREIHFSQEGAKALVCQIKEENGKRVVDVPNILLQKAETITAYVVTENEEGAETVWAKSFRVQARPRPENYVYTQTEVLNFSTLVERLEKLEGEGISQAVEAYLKENPVEVPDGSASIDVTAEVGQTIAVKSVDENGKPTEWEAVDMPTGGGGLDATIDGETLVFAESSTATIENETLIL